jgi:hypothetical protein
MSGVTHQKGTIFPTLAAKSEEAQRVPGFLVARYQADQEPV